MGRAILLCICGVLLAAACSIAYLGMHESYARLRDGKTYDGVVTEFRSDGMIFEYVDEQGEPQQRISQDPPQSILDELSVGSPVVVHRSSTDTKIAQEVQPPPILLLFGAGASLVFAVWIVLRARTLQRKFRAAVGDFDATLLLAISKSRGQYVAMFVIGLVFTAMFMIVVFAASDVSVASGVVLGLLALGSMFLAGLGGWRAWVLRDIRRSKIFLRLLQTPERVTHVQGIRAWAEGVPGATHYSFTVFFDDRYQFTISLGQIGVDEFLAALRERAPQAEFAV
ncbi:MAG: hypothetical protein H6712_29865 [Myxococcales bacterium]|nr:hypothetical protein [Myxococcales bacterium]